MARPSPAPDPSSVARLAYQNPVDPVMSRAARRDLAAALGGGRRGAGTEAACGA